MSIMVKKMLCCGARSFAASELPKDGHVPVWVGKDVQCKFELEANYLNHPVFENLLELSVEEFGYTYDGAVRIACEVELFLHLLQLLKTRNPSAHYLGLKDILPNFASQNHAKHIKDLAHEHIHD